MNWLILIAAGLFEIGWPIGLKMAQAPGVNKFPWILLAVGSIAISGVLLFTAQKTIPIGTAYAVWTGIGAIGSLLVGVMFFGDSSNILRMLSAVLIVVGIVGLKLF